MAANIFINLPVKDLGRSKQFFAGMGYSFNAQFTNENAACLVLGPTIYAMLLTEPTFQTFTKKQIADTTSSTEVLLALSAESRTEVDDLFARAIAAGGTQAREADDHGFMYGRSFEDLDGHTWELFWMDPGAINPA